MLITPFKYTNCCWCSLSHLIFFFYLQVCFPIFTNCICLLAGVDGFDSGLKPLALMVSSLSSESWHLQHSLVKLAWESQPLSREC